MLELVLKPNGFGRGPKILYSGTDLKHEVK